MVRGDGINGVVMVRGGGGESGVVLLLRGGDGGGFWSGTQPLFSS